MKTVTLKNSIEKDYWLGVYLMQVLKSYEYLDILRSIL